MAERISSSSSAQGLRVRAVEDGDVPVRQTAPVQILDLLRDESRFIVLRVTRVTDDQVAVPLCGPEVLVLTVEVVADHSVCGAQNVLRRAIVLFELDHLGTREVALELDDVADVGAPEGVDRLIRVAHHRETRGGDPTGGIDLPPPGGRGQPVDLGRFDRSRELAD